MQSSVSKLASSSLLAFRALHVKILTNSGSAKKAVFVTAAEPIE